MGKITFQRLVTLAAQIILIVGVAFVVQSLPDFSLHQTDIAHGEASGCTSSSPKTGIAPFVTTAHAAYFEPLRNPRYNIPDPFFYGVILHGCNPPTVDIKANGSDGPITVANGSQVLLAWSSTSAHGGLSCTASGAWSGAKTPSGSEITPALFGPATLTYTIRCTDADGSATDSVQVNVGTGNNCTVDLRANGSDGSITVDNGSTVTLSWTTSGMPASQISLTASGNWTGSKAIPSGSEVTAPLSGPNLYVYSLTGSTGSSFCSDSVFVNVRGTGPPPITGDIYAGGQIRNLTVFGPSVVSAQSGTPTITLCDPIQRVWCVSNYSPTLRSSWRTVMNDNLSRLISERALSWPPPGSDFDGPTDRLGGGVWYRSGNLDLSGDYTGRGTLIVDGNVRVTGNLRSNLPIGIVSRTGTITITANVESIINVYFYAMHPTNGAIIFENDPDLLIASGSFIAQQFVIPPRPIQITYSSTVAFNPPPGFVSFILPTILEQAP